MICFVEVICFVSSMTLDVRMVVTWKGREVVGKGGVRWVWGADHVLFLYLGNVGRSVITWVLCTELCTRDSCTFYTCSTEFLK